MSGNTGNKDNNSGERIYRRVYRDPTADAAIGNVMREERMKRRQEQYAQRKKRTAYHKGYGGGRHGTK